MLVGTGKGDEADGVDVRQVGDKDLRVFGVLDDRVTEAHLRRAAVLGKGLSRLFTDARMRRMRMAVNTFLRAASVPQLGDRIHQYVLPERPPSYPNAYSSQVDADVQKTIQACLASALAAPVSRARPE